MLRNLPQLRKCVCPSTLTGCMTRLAPGPLHGESLMASLESSGQMVDAPVPVELPDHGYVSSLPEIQLFLTTLALIYAIDTQQQQLSLKLADLQFENLKVADRRSRGLLVSKAYFYSARAYELAGKFQDIRENLFGAYRTASLQRDLMGQATTLNLLLRNYLHYDQHGLALKLVNKAPFPEHLRSNAQHARYLYYVGCIQAVQLEYSDAYTKLMQAIRKAPLGTKSGRGFHLAAYKMAIVVELLMGDIPDRQLFNQKSIRADLVPYQHIVLAVRGGDLSGFNAVAEKYAKKFERDRTLFLIQRLHHNVIRAGLRMINTSYSRISLVDVARKLGLESPADAEGIVSKAILDGVMDAVVDHENQAVQSLTTGDVYASAEPTKAFHKRISFCLQLHSEAVKAMQYPEEDDQDKIGEAEARRKERQEHLAIAEEDDVNGDIDMI